MRIGCLAAALLLVVYYPRTGSALECYVCNSDNDPRCGDPFGNYTIGKLNCSLKIPPEHLSPDKQESKICRKIIQKVYGKIRVIRTCGYITDEIRDNKMCQTRSGTHDVHLTYCSCTTDLCNSAPVSSTLSAPLAAILFITAIVFPL